MYTSLRPNLTETELNTPTNVTLPHLFSSSDLSSSSPTTNEDDMFIDRISSLLTSYLLSRQSSITALITSNTTHERETNSNSSDSAISLSTSTTTTTRGTASAVMSNELSSAIVANEVDKLLQRVKTAVDSRLSVKMNNNSRMDPPKNNENFLSSPLKTETKINRRQQLLELHAVSCQEEHSDDCSIEQSVLSNHRHHLELSSKSQSLDPASLGKYYNKSLTFIMLKLIIPY